MILNGGGFVKAIGHAARLADERNLDRLKAAFPDYWERYAQWVMPDDGTGEK